jgi:hypothetical protein
MTENNEYPEKVKRGAILLTIIVISFIWATIIGGFVFGLFQFWGSGGSFGSWSLMAVYFGIIVLSASTIGLSFFSVIFGKKLYLRLLDLIYEEIQKKEKRDVLEHEKLRHKKEKDKILIKLKRVERENKVMKIFLKDYFDKAVGEADSE